MWRFTVRRYIPDYIPACQLEKLFIDLDVLGFQRDPLALIDNINLGSARFVHHPGDGATTAVVLLEQLIMRRRKNGVLAVVFKGSTVVPGSSCYI